MATRQTGHIFRSGWRGGIHDDVHESDPDLLTWIKMAARPRHANGRPRFCDVGQWFAIAFEGSGNPDLTLSTYRIGRTFGPLRESSSGRDDRHAHQFGQALGLHLGHHIRPIDLNRARADPEVEGDRFIRRAGDETVEDLAFTL